MNCRGSEKGRSAIFKADETEPREGRGIPTEGEEDKFITRWKHPLKPSANQGGPSVIKAWRHVTFVSPARRLGAWVPWGPGGLASQASPGSTADAGGLLLTLSISLFNY